MAVEVASWYPPRAADPTGHLAAAQAANGSGSRSSREPAHRALLPAGLQRQRAGDQRRRHLPGALPAIRDLAVPHPLSRSDRDAHRPGARPTRRSGWCHGPAATLISLYPVVLPVLIAPLYLPAVGYLHLRGWTDGRLDHIARIMEKLSASLVAALSASLLYLLLRRRAAAPIALLLTLAYAFGTTTWVISSQALWQHGMAELLVVGAPAAPHRAVHRAAGARGGVAVRAHRRQPPAGCHPRGGAGRLRTVLGRPPGGAARRGGGAAGGPGAALQPRRGRPRRRRLRAGRQGHASSSTTCCPASPDCCSARRAGCSSSRPSCSSSSWPGGTCRATAASAASRLAMGAGVVLQVLLYAKADWRGRHLLGAALHDRPPAAAHLDAGAGGRRPARLRPGVLPARGRRRGRHQAIGAFWYTGATDSRSSPLPAVLTRCGPRGTGGTRRSSLPCRGLAPAESDLRDH